jgi:Uma2 family endonuclease
MATLTRPLSYDEWLHMPPVEDGTDEVVYGELRFMPPTHYPHAEIIQNLIVAFLSRVDKKKVAILGSNFGLMISRDPLTCRSPDFALYQRENMKIQDGLYWSPPDLIVEVLSPSENRRRKLRKIEDYARISVPEVWIVSPETETVEVHLLKDGKLVSERIVREGELSPARFAGASIAVAQIWPEETD